MESDSIHQSIYNLVWLKQQYQALIFVGILIFIAGSIGDANAIPFLRHGMVIGPLSFVVGVLIWIPLRIKNPIKYPYSPKDFVSHYDAFWSFMFNNFILEFWAFVCAFTIVILLSTSIFMKHTDAYKKGIEVFKDNTALINKIGKYRGTGLLIGGTITNYCANLDFSVYGSSGGSRVQLKMNNDNGDWVLESFEFIK